MLIHFMNVSVSHLNVYLKNICGATAVGRQPVKELGQAQVQLLSETLEL